MILTPVASMNVAAIGYLEEEQVLLVRYRDGSLHARPAVSPDEHAALMAAGSKGKFLHAMRGQSILIVCEKATAKKSLEVAPEPKRAEPLNVLDDEAGKCCQRSFAKHGYAVSPTWCESCGMEFRRDPVGPVTYWRIVPMVAVFRR